MKASFLTALCCLSVATAHAVAAERFIVEDGQPKAEIIIANAPPRATRLATQELQNWVENMSGAKLAIVTQPSGKVSVKMRFRRI